MSNEPDRSVVKERLLDTVSNLLEAIKGETAKEFQQQCLDDANDALHRAQHHPFTASPSASRSDFPDSATLHLRAAHKHVTAMIAGQRGEQEIRTFREHLFHIGKTVFPAKHPFLKVLKSQAGITEDDHAEENEDESVSDNGSAGEGEVVARRERELRRRMRVEDDDDDDIIEGLDDIFDVLDVEQGSVLEPGMTAQESAEHEDTAQGSGME